MESLRRKMLFLRSKIKNMKVLSLICSGLIVLASCSSGGLKDGGGKQFGSAFDTSTAVSMSALASQMGDKSSMDCTVKGTISEVCQSEGCWFTVQNEGAEPVTVRMRDHGFTVPKNIAGKVVFFKGTAKTDTTSVETLRDYAKDAGKSEAEIEAIQSPKVELVVEADGVLLQ